MTNFEKFYEEIKELYNTYFDAELAVKNGRPVNCHFIECKECDLFSEDDPRCDIKTLEWLSAKAED